MVISHENHTCQVSQAHDTLKKSLVLLVALQSLDTTDSSNQKLKMYYAVAINHVYQSEVMPKCHTWHDNDETNLRNNMPLGKNLHRHNICRLGREQMLWPT